MKMTYRATAALFIEYIYFFGYTKLWKDIEVQPAHSAFEANVAREHSCILDDSLPCLFCCQPLDSEVTSFAEDM